MASGAQKAANRRNAAASSGPRSAKGKARSSRNAERHGLLAEDTVIVGESPAELIELFDSYHERFQLAGTLEQDLIAGRVSRTLARLAWPQDQRTTSTATDSPSPK